MLTSAEGAVYAKRGSTFGTHSLIGRSHQRAKIPFATLYSLGLRKNGTNRKPVLIHSPAARESPKCQYRTKSYCFAFGVSALPSDDHPSGLRRSHQFCSFASGQRAVLGDPWGGRQQQRQQLYNPFGGGFWGDRPGGFWGDRQAPRYPRQREREREQPPDYSRAPPATPRKDATVKIVVMGDANADWLAYGLEDAFADNPEIGIVRKHRTNSGLVRYDPRRDSDWPQMAREIIAAEKPKFVVMMIGNNDRQTIREKAPPAAEWRAEGERASGSVGYCGRPAHATGPRAAAA